MWKEDEVRELHCACGNRLVAENDEVLVRQVLDHAHEVHPEMDLDEGQARDMAASEASDTEETSYLTAERRPYAGVLEGVPAFP